MLQWPFWAIEVSAIYVYDGVNVQHSTAQRSMFEGAHVQPQHSTAQHSAKKQDAAHDNLVQHGTQ